MPSIAGLTTSSFDPASRVRFIQFIPHLEQAGWTVDHWPNRPDRYWSSPLPGRIPRAIHHRLGRVVMLANRLRDIASAPRYDVVFVNRDLAGDNLFFEQRLLRNNPRVVFDFDDAIFLGKGERTTRWMCEHAAWVTPGNEYLAEWARRFTQNVLVVPTVVDTDRYVPRCAGSVNPGLVRVGWSGSDQSIRYTLFPWLPILAEAQRVIPFELVIVTNTRPTLPVSDLRWSFIPWTAESESHISSAFDVGIMPLEDNEFQRGKCGLKLLQYMAAGLPAIASPVGVNARIVLHGETGFLARSQADWRDAIATLVSSADLRSSMGQAGRTRCERSYSIRAWLPVLLQVFDCVSRSRVECIQAPATQPLSAAGTGNSRISR